MDSPQLQFIVVFDISVIAHGQIPMVVEILQLQCVDMVVQVSLHARCVHRQMPWSMFSRSSSTVVDVAVMPQRPVPVVGLNSWNDG